MAEQLPNGEIALRQLLCDVLQEIATEMARRRRKVKTGPVCVGLRVKYGDDEMWHWAYDLEITDKWPGQILNACERVIREQEDALERADSTSA